MSSIIGIIVTLVIIFAAKSIGEWWHSRQVERNLDTLKQEFSDNVTNEDSGNYGEPKSTKPETKLPPVDQVKPQSQQQADEWARKSLSDTIRALGCNPGPDDEYGFFFKYQGENFIVRNHGYSVRIWDAVWLEVDKQHPDMPLILKVINEVNHNFGPKIVYATKSEDNKIYEISSLFDMTYHPRTPERVESMQFILEQFFNVKHDFYRKMEIQSQTATSANAACQRLGNFDIPLN